MFALSRRGLSGTRHRLAKSVKYDVLGRLVGQRHQRAFIAWPLAPALVLLLVCVVSLGVLDKREIECTGCWWLTESVRNESNRIAHNEHQPAKMSCVLWGVGKNIVIFHPSPKIDESSERLSFQNILRGDGDVLGCHPASRFDLWRNHSTANVGILIDKHMTGGQYRVTNVAFNVRPELFSRRSTSIPVSGSKAEVIQTGGRIGFPKIHEPIRTNESPLISNQSLFSQPRLFLYSGPLSSRVPRVKRTDYEQSDLNQHRWRVPGFIVGAILFTASFLFGVKCSERSEQRRLRGFVNAARDSWFWLDWVCNIGLFVGAFLMLIWPHLS
jgi:hypothetical protein